MTKHIYGSGTVFKRKDGRWMAAAFDDETKKRIYAYGATRKDAIKKLNGKMENMDSSEGVCKNYKLEDWIWEYLEVYKRNELKPSTFTGYTTVWRKHIKGSVIGKMNLSKIRPTNIQAFYNQKLKAGLSVKSVWQMRNLISTALKQAVREGYIEKNPDEYIVLPKKQR